MIQELKMYTVICDNCGKDALQNCEYGCYYDGGTAVEQAQELDWIVDDNKHYCTNCAHFDDDDKLVIDTARTKTIVP